MQDIESYSYELFDIETLSYSYNGDIYSYGSEQDLTQDVDTFESVTSLDVSTGCILLYQRASHLEITLFRIINELLQTK